ncbi:hypothetical protein F4805DRAFT_476159 [Annulohypoxylon moriforme]|nr:hypothetical protein F4805DRAFT_476159 [Annulohypoxylon moriforme]
MTTRFEVRKSIIHLIFRILERLRREEILKSLITLMKNPIDLSGYRVRSSSARAVRCQALVDMDLESDLIPTDYPITCCSCGENDYFDHVGNPYDSLCRHCGHQVCSSCQYEGSLGDSEEIDQEDGGWGGGWGGWGNTTDESIKDENKVDKSDGNGDTSASIVAPKSQGESFHHPILDNGLEGPAINQKELKAFTDIGNESETSSIFERYDPQQWPAEIQERYDGRIPEYDDTLITTDAAEGGGASKLNSQSHQINSFSNASGEDPYELNSDVSSNEESVFSGSITNPSTEVSTGEGINTLLIQELADLLLQDEVVTSYISTAVSKKGPGFEWMRNRFRKLLKFYALDLRSEAHESKHISSATFISSFSSNITRELFSSIYIGGKFEIPASLRDIPDRREKVNNYIRDHLSNAEPIELDEDSDEDSVEDIDEFEPYDGSLFYLDQLKQFITGSAAYKNLRRRLYESAYPNLRSKLRNRLEKWSRYDHKYHVHVARYGLLDLAAELQYINPHEIQFLPTEKINYMTTLIGYCQDMIEYWTGEHWDWSPLPRYAGPLKIGEARIRWECSCGEKKHAKVSLAFSKRLRSIIQSLPQTTQPPTTTSHVGSSGLASTSNTQSHASLSRKSQGHQQPAGPPSSNATQSRSPNQAAVVNTGTTDRHILFLVERGEEHMIKQIDVNDNCCQRFFSTLKTEYICLRGFIRIWFSIWIYSHCDFYQSIKYDDHQFAPVKKDVFPEVTNADYEYEPRPMRYMPPICNGEFRKRFYARDKSKSSCHCPHGCITWGMHSGNVLDLFPKKTTKLEESGDKREDFWGIYARERISFGRVLAYNIGCALPMLVVFALRVLPAKYATDLQNPSVPFSMMLGMLSLFWSIFLSSLQFGKSVG